MEKQAAKYAADPVEEMASNVVASTRFDVEKSKITAQGRVEKMTTHDQVEKQRATEKKQEKIHHAVLGKQEARQHNASKQATAATSRMAPTPTGGMTTFSANPSGHQI